MSRARFTDHEPDGNYVPEALSIQTSIFNLLDSRSSDIDYFYTSCLPGEPAGGVSHIHTHRPSRAKSASPLLRSFDVLDAAPAVDFGRVIAVAVAQ